MFCSDSQRSYLARVWCFQVRRTRGLILPYSEAKLFSVIYPVNYTVFHSSCCEHIILGPSHMSRKVLPLILLGASFPGLRQLPQKRALINHQVAEDLKETFWKSLGLSLHAAHSSLVLDLENSSSPHLPGLQSLSSTPGRLPGSARVSTSVPCLVNSPYIISWGNHRAHLICSPSLRNHCSLLSDSQCYENLIHVFCHGFSSLK